MTNSAAPIQWTQGEGTTEAQRTQRGTAAADSREASDSAGKPVALHTLREFRSSVSKGAPASGVRGACSRFRLTDWPFDSAGKPVALHTLREARVLPCFQAASKSSPPARIQTDCSTQNTAGRKGQEASAFDRFPVARTVSLRQRFVSVFSVSLWLNLTPAGELLAWSEPNVAISPST